MEKRLLKRHLELCEFVTAFNQLADEMLTTEKVHYTAAVAGNDDIRETAAAFYHHIKSIRSAMLHSLADAGFTN